MGISSSWICQSDLRPICSSSGHPPSPRASRPAAGSDCAYNYIIFECGPCAPRYICCVTIDEICMFFGELRPKYTNSIIEWAFPYWLSSAKYYD